MAYRINIAGCQQVAFTSSGSTSSSAVLDSKAVVLYSTKDVFVRTGTTATATATGNANVFIPAETYVELDTTGLEQHVMAARGASESGTLYINPLVTVR